MNGFSMNWCECFVNGICVSKLQLFISDVLGCLFNGLTCGLMGVVTNGFVGGLWVGLKWFS